MFQLTVQGQNAENSARHREVLLDDVKRIAVVAAKYVKERADLQRYPNAGHQNGLKCPEIKVTNDNEQRMNRAWQIAFACVFVNGEAVPVRPCSGRNFTRVWGCEKVQEVYGIADLYSIAKEMS